MSRRSATSSTSTISSSSASCAPSLQALGFTTPEEIKTVGMMLMNWQMVGTLVGGILWGVLGDRRGRVSVLFGSIILYSLANGANGFVHDTTTYAALRFIAGIGLAGELGVGIGAPGSAAIVMGISFAVAFVSLAVLKEIFGKDLDFTEPD